MPGVEISPQYMGLNQIAMSLFEKAIDIINEEYNR